MDIFIEKIKEIIKGFLGGIFIALCCIMTIKISNLNLEYGFLINSFLFPIGIIMCNLCGGSLFTGNCYYFIESNSLAFEKIFQSLSGNFLGMFVMSIISFPYLIGLRMNYINDSFLYLFISGVFCNILITVATYIAKNSKTKLELIVGMWFPVMLFVICGFHHGVVMLFYHMFNGISTINTIIVILGNIVGGFIISKLIKVCE